MQALTPDALTPAGIRDLMAVAGCYGDGTTPPAEPCDHQPDECAAALSRSLTDDQLRDGANELMGSREFARMVRDGDDDGWETAAWRACEIARDAR